MHHTLNDSFKAISINSSSVYTLSSSILKWHDLVIQEEKEIKCENLQTNKA